MQRLQIDKRLRGFNLVDRNRCFCQTTCTRGYTTPEIQSPDPEISDIKPGFQLKFFRFLFSGMLCLTPLVQAPPARTLVFSAARVSPGHAVQ